MLPAELRELIWLYLIPRGQRLILDPLRIPMNAPNHPFAGAIHWDTPPLLLTSRSVYNEVLGLIYSGKVLAITDPFSSTHICIDHYIPLSVCHRVERMEFCANSPLVDMYRFLQSMRDYCHSLEHLKLIMYHSNHTLPNVGALAFASWQTLGFALKLELYQSTWAYTNNHTFTEQHLATWLGGAKQHASAYKLELPKRLRVITVAMSVQDQAAATLRRYGPQLHTGTAPVDWIFNQDGNQDTAAVKYLVWESPNLEDTSSDTDPGYQLKTTTEHWSENRTPHDLWWMIKTCWNGSMLTS